MENLEFIGLTATEDPHRWVMPVIPELCTFDRFMFGGVGLGASIEALERTTGRPTVWAAAQYLSYARPPSVLDIEVTVLVSGRSVTQARAVARVGDVEILTVNAALGHRDLDVSGQLISMPEVPDVASSPLRPNRWESTLVTIMDRIEMKMADAVGFEEFDGTIKAGGRSALWARIPDLPAMTAAKLAILGDYVPFGIGQAFGRFIGGNSLDNTLRVINPVETEWVLIDVEVHALQNGFGHGLVHLWAEDGTLIGTASQSTIAREWTGSIPEPLTP